MVMLALNTPNFADRTDYGKCTPALQSLCYRATKANRRRGGRPCPPDVQTRHIGVESMTINRALSIGTRVRIRGNPSGIQLRSGTGEIIRQDEKDGYFIIRLDEPAISYDDPGTEQEISESVEDADNLDVN